MLVGIAHKRLIRLLSSREIHCIQRTILSSGPTALVHLDILILLITTLAPTPALTLALFFVRLGILITSPFDARQNLPPPFFQPRAHLPSLTLDRLLVSPQQPSLALEPTGFTRLDLFLDGFYQVPGLFRLPLGMLQQPVDVGEYTDDLLFRVMSCSTVPSVVHVSEDGSQIVVPEVTQGGDDTKCRLEGDGRGRPIGLHDELDHPSDRIDRNLRDVLTAHKDTLDPSDHDARVQRPTVLSIPEESFGGFQARRPMCRDDLILGPSSGETIKPPQPIDPDPDGPWGTPDRIHRREIQPSYFRLPRLSLLGRRRRIHSKSFDL
jgi:hypothetical protein